MACDKCGAPSVYHSTLIVNGVSKKTSLCRDCAIKEGVFNNQPTNLFDDMFSSFADMLGFEQVENVVCPVCKTTLREFKSTGKLGCPNCYDMFREEISNIIKRIAPFETHKQDAIKTKPTKVEKPSKEEQIKALREQMKQAVSEERYEDAAKIKKQITKLESANE
ncbi:MAG: UvrB/UvrC motif-containing protein [Clostridia bacterium]|nr:UvrB/UvrC motif-containing protein [Clostridia bacterium]